LRRSLNSNGNVEEEEDVEVTDAANVSNAIAVSLQTLNPETLTNDDAHISDAIAVSLKTSERTLRPTSAK